MKISASLIAALCLMINLFISTEVNATDKKKTIEFKVTGNCSMCKKTVESSLKGKKGVETAVWDQKTKVMKVVYDSAAISEEQIHQNIADSGYDTEKKEASSKSYNSLPKCCQYERSLHSKK